jgi:acyl-CoA synthetase (NDP forming)
MRKNKLMRNISINDRHTLTEAESKVLLSIYGVPFVTEAVVLSADEAARHAAEFGYPVVLKGLGANLTHKTERGVVKLDLRSAKDVREAFHEIKISSGDEWEGCLVQPLVAGKRELVAGLFRDPQFGPVVMFGLGGIYTEAIRDVVFRIAPVSRDDAFGMMDRLLSGKLLSAFRGEAPADRELLAQTLTGLSELGLNRPDIAEVDINPLIIRPDGRVTAVDALVIMQTGNSDQTVAGKPSPLSADNEKNTIHDLHLLFHPGSIAIVGASPDENKLGNLLVKGFLDMGYTGKLYCVNQSATDRIFSRPVYPTIEDIPDEVVLAIICTPPSTVPSILKQCARKSVKGVVLFVTPANNGQSELKKAVEDLKSLGIRISGPNSMGFHNPASGMSIWPLLPARVGPVASICHSGGVTFAVLTAIEARGIGCSKAVSVGNEWDLNWTDYLEYFGHDDETKIITGYLEGMVDGRRFLRIATKVGKKKPIICIKGGQSSTGNTFAGSHTGGMAGSEFIWKAAFDQANIISVIDFQDLITHTVMFDYLMSRTLGRRIGLVTGTGGPTVITADLCEQHGLELPEFSAATKENLKKILPPYGSSYRNPADVSISAAVDQSLYSRSINILDRSPDVDVIICIHTGDSAGEAVASKIILDNSSSSKPLVVIMVGSSEKNSQPVNMLLKAGIPAFDVQEGAIRALSALIRWKERSFYDI